MTNALPQNESRSQKISPRANPLVCKYQPFVCSRNSLFEPFVGINIPVTPFLPSARKVLGFTLIELVVTVTIAMVLVSIAVPSFRTLTQNNRMTTQINDLIADLSYARSEAIKRRTNVSICTSSDGVTCTGGSWTGGRLLAIGGPPLALVPLRYRGPSDAATDTLTSNALDPFNFDSRGATSIAIRFTFCDVRGVSSGKILNVNTIGQATIDRTTPPVATCL